MSLTASGVNDFSSAASIRAWRNTHGRAPVTATRTVPVLAGDEDADDGVARCDVGEFCVGGAFGEREADRGHDLAFAQRGGERAGKESFGGDAAFGGDDARAQRHECRRIVGCRIGMGDRAAERGSVAHRGVGHLADQPCQVGNCRADNFGAGDFGMLGHRADDDIVALAANEIHLVDQAQIDEVGGPRAPSFQRRNERHAAGEKSAVAACAHNGGGFGERLRLMIVEIVHGRRPAALLNLPAAMAAAPALMALMMFS